jgi:hypothetical protein
MYEFIDNNGNYYVIISAGGHFCVYITPVNAVQVVTATKNVVTGRNTNVVAHGESVGFLQSIPWPYQDGDLNDIDYTQDNDVLILTHPNYPPGRIFISSYNGDLPPTFAFMFLDIYPLPAYDFNEINYNNFTVVLTVSGSTLTFKFTGVGADPGFTNAWIGGQIIGGGATEIDPIGYAIITAVSYSSSGGGTVTFTGIVQVPFLTTGYATFGSQYSIRQPAWSAALGYPAKVLFFQNRLWLGNTAALPNTVFGSKINSPINFDVGTGRDTDAIVYTIGQTNSGAILWMNGGKQMEIFCRNFEFACPQDQNSALTPSTFSIRQQSAYGASAILKPVTYINDSYYGSRAGRALINFHYNGIGLTYTSSNISVASTHLVKNPNNRALLRGSDTSQDNFIYFLNNDNTLTAFQFATEYKLAALTPIVFEPNVDLIDIVTINNSIYILKFYALTDQFTLEQFDDDFRIDGAINASMNTLGVVTGLDLYNGYTVQVTYLNQDYGQYLVIGGTITVNNAGQSGGIFVGLLYDVEITPMYLFGGTTASPFYKQMSRIYVDYVQSLNFYINGILVPYQNYADIQAGLPLVPQTDTAIVAPVLGYDRFQTFSITQSSPFDLQITAIGYQIEAVVI